MRDESPLQLLRDLNVSALDWKICQARNDVRLLNARQSRRHDLRLLNARELRRSLLCFCRCEISSARLDGCDCLLHFDLHTHERRGSLLRFARCEIVYARLDSCDYLLSFRLHTISFRSLALRGCLLLAPERGDARPFIRVRPDLSIGQVAHAVLGSLDRGADSLTSSNDAPFRCS